MPAIILPKTDITRARKNMNPVAKEDNPACFMIVDEKIITEHTPEMKIQPIRYNLWYA